MFRKPWMTPIIYNDDRFVEPTQGITHHSSESQLAHRYDADDLDERNERDIESLLSRESKEVADNKTSDTSPLDYSRGPHDNELDVSDRDFQSRDEEPINYARGEHDEEVGLDDDDELDDAGPEESIDPYAND